ncbi:NAD-dependent epimerase/dehydratase family protein [Patescibacteria group bacterium]|nr:NAD-dependent epimerase/dehydratase family protein [Patescibacteria group bacterium]
MRQTPKRGFESESKRHGKFIKKIKNSFKISVGNLETTRDYIYIDDIIDAIFLIMKKNENFNNQIYNFGTGIGTSGIEVVKLVAYF